MCYSYYVTHTYIYFFFVQRKSAIGLTKTAGEGQCVWPTTWRDMLARLLVVTDKMCRDQVDRQCVAKPGESSLQAATGDS
jgi:hypothetical protein